MSKVWFALCGSFFQSLLLAFSGSLLAAGGVTDSPFSLSEGADLALQQAGFVADRFNAALYRDPRWSSFHPSVSSEPACRLSSDPGAVYEGVCSVERKAERKEQRSQQDAWLKEQNQLTRKKFPHVLNWEESIGGVCDDRIKALHTQDLSLEEALDEVRRLASLAESDPLGAVSSLQKIRVSRAVPTQRASGNGPSQSSGGYQNSSEPRVWETWSRDDVCGWAMHAGEGADPLSHLLVLYSASEEGRDRKTQICLEESDPATVLSRLKTEAVSALERRQLSWDTLIDEIKPDVSLEKRQSLARELKPGCNVRKNSNCYCLGDEARSRSIVDRVTANRLAPEAEKKIREIQKKFEGMVEGMGLSPQLKDAVLKDMRKLPIEVELYDSSVFNAFYVQNERKVMVPTLYSAALALGQPTEDFELTLIHEFGHHFAHAVSDLSFSPEFCIDHQHSSGLAPGCRTSGGRASIQPNDLKVLESYRGCLDRNILEGEWQEVLAPGLVHLGAHGGASLTAEVVKAKRQETFADFFMTQYLRTERSPLIKKGGWTQDQRANSVAMLCADADLTEHQGHHSSVSTHAHDSHADPRYRIPMILNGTSAAASESQSPTMRCENVLWPEAN